MIQGLNPQQILRYCAHELGLKHRKSDVDLTAVVYDSIVCDTVEIQ